MMEGFRARPMYFRAVNSIVIASCLVAFTIPVLIGVGSATVSTTGGGAERELSDQERAAIWQDCVANFASSPVAGVGLGMPVSSIERRSTVGAEDERTGPVWYCHSAVLNYFSAAGLLGGSAVIFLVVGTLSSLGRGLAATRYGETLAKAGQGWAIMYGNAGVVVTLPFAFIEGGLQGMMPSLLVWFLAFGVARRRVPHQKTQGTGSTQSVRQPSSGFAGSADLDTNDTNRS
jgi:hypothetical protein